MGQLFYIAVRNLTQHARRTLLLGGAIAGVTALLVLLLGLSNGVREIMLESATTLVTGHLNIGGFYKVTSGMAAPVVTHHSKVEEIVREAVPELTLVTQRGRGWAKIVSLEGSVQVGIGGIDIDNEPRLRSSLTVLSGEVDGLRKPNTILLFEEQVKKLNVKVGDVMTLSAPTLRGVNNTLDVTLVAIAKNAGLLSSFNVFMPDKSLRALYQLNDETTGALHLYVKNLDEVPAIQRRLREVLEQKGYRIMKDDPRAFFMKFESVNREDWTGQKLDVTTWKDEIFFMQQMLTALDSLSVMLTVVLLVIIGIGIMNTMWITIRERTREIGTLRAIGMQRSRVMAMFLVESLCLGLFGTVSGALGGACVAYVANLAKIGIPTAMQLFLMGDTLSLAVDTSAVAGAIVLITFCTTLISLIPSFLAARMKPITAMHHIG